MDTSTDPDLVEGIDEDEIIDSSEIDGDFSDPFDPNLIRVTRSTPTLHLLLNRIKEGEVNLAPDFQRRGGIWNEGAKSRLIESLLIRIPLPAFYVDATDENYWLVVDGLQRLTTLKEFVIDKSLILTGLEFLGNDLHGKTFDDLPRSLQRRIEETEVTVFQIEPGTPEAVKFNIFKRINTGGLPLSSQEIRNAINGNRVRNFISSLAQSAEFKEATFGSIGDKRMADRECVTRFLAFWINSPENYKTNDFDNFLNETMAQLDDPEQISGEQLEECRDAFLSAMIRARKVFGKFAFRKYFGPNKRRQPISKALFETTSWNLARLSDEEADVLANGHDYLLEDYARLIADNDFANAISQGTGSPNRVRLRFEGMQKLLRDNLDLADCL
jgi:hypothetical protein